MLRMTTKNVMGRLYVAIYCNAHGMEYPHCVWSRSTHVGCEDPASELHALADAGGMASRAWDQGEFDFSDDCFPGSDPNPWDRQDH